MGALTVIQDPNYELIHLESTIGIREKQIYIRWRDWMKKNERKELDNFGTNIIVINFIDLMRKLILGID